MNTSYFAKSGKNANAVSIAFISPKWFSGRRYEKLAPKYWLLKKFKEDLDEQFYIEHYYSEVLNRLDPQEVYNELGPDCILLCWEKSGKFCHRHLIAKWFNECLGIEVSEI